MQLNLWKDGINSCKVGRINNMLLSYIMPERAVITMCVQPYFQIESFSIITVTGIKSERSSAEFVKCLIKSFAMIFFG